MVAAKTREDDVLWAHMRLKACYDMVWNSCGIASVWHGLTGEPVW